jgi:hypothetical protein
LKEGADERNLLLAGGEGERGRGGTLNPTLFACRRMWGIWKLIGGGGGVVQATYMHPIDSSFIMNEIFLPRKFT